MPLDKLRGFGPWFAFAVPILFLFTMGYWVLLTEPARAAVHQLVGVALPQLAPSDAAVGLWLVLWALTVLQGLVVAIDLGIEHPLTNTPMAYVALGGMVVGTIAFIAFLVNGFASFFGAGSYYVVTFLEPAGLGVYLVVINLVGKWAGLLGRVLPWLGVVSGALFLFAALLIGVGSPEGAVFGFFAGGALYSGWSLWLGFRLRGKAPEPAVSSIG
jgi:hypothetical protein